MPPLTLHHGLSRPWTHDRCFDIGFDQKETSLSLWNPIDQIHLDRVTDSIPNKTQKLDDYLRLLLNSRWKRIRVLEENWCVIGSNWVLLGMKSDIGAT